jgi:hypothetical protein
MVGLAKTSSASASVTRFFKLSFAVLETVEWEGLVELN